MNEEIMIRHYEKTPKETLIKILVASREEVEKLQKRNKELKQEIERLNNKLELISTLVEREFPPNEFITYRMKKILRGVDKE